jgi:hypothetical protein
VEYGERVMSWYCGAMQLVAKMSPGQEKKKDNLFKELKIILRKQRVPFAV